MSIKHTRRRVPLVIGSGIAAMALALTGCSSGGGTPDGPVGPGSPGRPGPR